MDSLSGTGQNDIRKETETSPFHRRPGLGFALNSSPARDTRCHVKIKRMSESLCVYCEIQVAKPHDDRTRGKRKQREREMVGDSANHARDEHFICNSSA